MESIILALITVILGGSLSVGGDSFIITDLNDSNVVTRGIVDLQYPFACIFKCFVLVDGELKETTYKDPINLVESDTPPILEDVPKTIKSKDLSLLIQHIDRVFWANEYKITARVFDKTLNPNGDYWATYGFIKNADVNVKILGPLPEKDTLVTLKGKTSETGYYQDKFYIAANIVPGGTYEVIVNATDGTSYVSKTLSLIIIGQVPDGGSRCVTNCG